MNHIQYVLKGFAGSQQQVNDKDKEKQKFPQQQ